MEKRSVFLLILLIVLSIASLTISGVIVIKTFSKKPSSEKSYPSTSNTTPKTSNTCVNKNSLRCADEPELSYECSEEYKSWAQIHCPDWTTEGQFCGGIAGTTCPEGYSCQLEGEYPDAGGTCKKTDASPDTYICPVNGWVDCMPGPDIKPECSVEAMAWYKINCPDFKGGAL